ncbi:hypothetical protein CTI12_AA540920 [Artemisia annua]|uniref:Uncharacterized protein n=1 Tax=Artemisia annua TaxID=35608 RepID=A0A2U1L1L9_ARTAN|nr:hypothetical protein CTI12_AA540920 [Artemisia annua]
MEVSGSYNRKDVLAESMYPRDSRILLVPMNQEARECWLEFTKDALWREDEGEVLVDPHHPIVILMSNFAVSAFNELCRMYYKKGQEKNIYGAQVTKFIFTTNDHGCTFFITIEALEEDVLGVYQATVICTIPEGERTLIEFTRLPLSPTGTKYKGMDNLISEKFFSDAVKEKEKYLKSLLKIRCNARKGDKKSRLSGDIQLKKDYEAYAGARRLFDKYAPQLKRRSWKIKTSSSDGWLVPDEKTGLQPRSNEHTFGGYDYLNPFKSILVLDVKDATRTS